MPSTTFTYTGDVQTYTVPAGVNQVTVECWGAAGGNGGNGAYIKGEVPVTPDETLDVYVGGQNGYNGGGSGGGASHSDWEDGENGGGSSDVFAADGTLLACAGGGGGAGGNNSGGGSGLGYETASSRSNGGNGGYTGYYGGSQDGHKHGGGGGGAGYGGGAGGDAGVNQGENGNGGGSHINGSKLTGSNGARSGHGQVVISYPDPPATPNNVSQTVTGDDSCNVTWGEDTSAGTPDHYDVEKSTDGGSSWTSLSTNVTGTSYTASLSAGDDTVLFRVRAVNAGGSSSWVQTTEKSTDITSVTVSNVTGTGFDLSWDSADDATDYDVLLAEASGSTEADYTIDQTVTSTSATVSGLEHGEKYYARPIARYPNADSLGPEKSTTTSLPAPVVDSLDVSVQREVTVNYTLNDNSSDGDVLVELSRDGGSTWEHSQTVSDLSATSVTFTGLLDGEEYTARITRTTDHASAQSGTASAITILPAPGDLTHPTVGDTTADYEWTPNHNYGSTRVEYKPTSGSSWQSYSTLGNNATSETVDGLRNGEEYDSRVVAETEHAETVDQ